MKTSKFAITLIAFFATNAHAQLTNAPDVNKLEEAEICRAVATYSIVAFSDEIVETSKSDLDVQDKNIIIDALSKDKSEASAAGRFWDKKVKEARMQGMPETLKVTQLLTNSSRSKDTRHYLIQNFYQDCQINK